MLFAALMALSPWYGFDRDELYFLDAAHHLQGGYVDQPVFAPLLARFSLALFGVSLPGLRLWPALAAAASVILAGLIARECGGGRRAQLLAAIGTATMPVLLAADHLEGPTAFDLLAWVGLAFVVIRIGRGADQRWWLLGGLDLGLGVANKHSVAFFAAAIVVGALCVRGYREIFNRWSLAAVLIASLFAVPDLIWQAQHGWATIAMTRQLNAENGGLGNIPSWIFGQLIMTCFALIPMWIAGLRRLWRSALPLWRALVIAYILLFVFFAVTTGAKIYYLAGAYVYLLAAGAVSFEARLAERRSRRRLGGWVAVTTLGALPLVLPVLPSTDIGWTYSINQVPAESVGWPHLVQQVAAAWHRLPTEQRSRAVIFTADYGEVGAINELGRGDGLPIAVSGQNSEWWWGPGNPAATTVLAVAPGPVDVTDYGGYLRKFFGKVRIVATLTNGAGLRNQEWDGHIYLCTDPLRPWGQMWPRLRHYD